MITEPVKSESMERVGRMARALYMGASPLAVRAEFSPTRREMQAAAKRAQRMRREAR